MYERSADTIAAEKQRLTAELKRTHVTPSNFTKVDKILALLDQLDKLERDIELKLSNMFHKKLKRTRLKSGFNQQQAAEALGVSFSTYRNWEKGRTLPPSEPVLTQAQIIKTLCDKG